jgi:putative PIN family toxin of toxin-antitoxin system
MRMRVVLDTDVVVAGVLSPRGASRQWLMAALRGDVRILISVPLVLEYEAVLKRRDNLIRARAQTADIDHLLDNLLLSAELVEIAFLWRPTLGDPGDDMVLEAAVNGRAELLLTFNARDFAGASAFGIAVERPGAAWRRKAEFR